MRELHCLQRKKKETEISTADASDIITILLLLNLLNHSH